VNPPSADTGTLVTVGGGAIKIIRKTYQNNYEKLCQLI